MVKMKIKNNYDFTYTVTFKSGVEFIFREIVPEDFYFYEFEVESSEQSELESLFALYRRLIVQSTEDIADIPLKDYRQLQNWISEELLQGKLMTVENWLGLAFKLMKNQFTSDLTWFEQQPMSKILAMVEIQSRYVQSMREEQQRK